MRKIIIGFIKRPQETIIAHQNKRQIDNYCIFGLALMKLKGKFRCSHFLSFLLGF